VGGGGGGGFSVSKMNLLKVVGAVKSHFPVEELVSLRTTSGEKNSQAALSRPGDVPLAVSFFPGGK